VPTGEVIPRPLSPYVCAVLSSWFISPRKNYIQDHHERQFPLPLPMAVASQPTCIARRHNQFSRSLLDGSLSVASARAGVCPMLGCLPLSKLRRKAAWLPVRVGICGTS